MARSKYLATLTDEQQQDLKHRLHDRQAERCFICDKKMDLVLQQGQLEVDHIDPLAEDGLDAENNFALTHASCNRSKGASNLKVARRIAEFDRLQEKARQAEEAGVSEPIRPLVETLHLLVAEVSPAAKRAQVALKCNDVAAFYVIARREGSSVDEARTGVATLVVGLYAAAAGTDYQGVR